MTSTSLQHFVKVYDGDLDAPLTSRMIESFHALQKFQLANGRGVRAGLEQSAWTELNVSRLSDAGFLAMFRRRIERALAQYNADVGLTIPIPDSHVHADLILKRYRPHHDERFELHFDAINHVANRYLVLLWYLNDVAEGGETRFPHLDISVTPKAGRLLVFPPYWMYQHEGVPPISGDKFILSTYLLFTDPAPDA